MRKTFIETSANVLVVSTIIFTVSMGAGMGMALMYKMLNVLLCYPTI